MVLGANDGWPLEAHDVGSNAWNEEYARRVEAVSRDFIAGDPQRRVYWVGPPVPRSAPWIHIFARINDAVRAAVPNVPGLRYVDVAGPTSDHGSYTDYLTDPAGNRILARQHDGIHFSFAGLGLPGADHPGLAAGGILAGLTALALTGGGNRPTTSACLSDLRANPAGRTVPGRSPPQFPQPLESQLIMAVYLDHAATTPMLPAAVDAMTARLGVTGNANSLHAAGRAARRVVEESREQIAEALGARPSEVVFTSGGTESDNLAVKGLYWARRDADPRRRRILARRRSSTTPSWTR